jgi:hypothetical protein
MRVVARGHAAAVVRHRLRQVVLGALDGAAALGVVEYKVGQLVYPACNMSHSGHCTLNMMYHTTRKCIPYA